MGYDSFAILKKKLERAKGSKDEIKRKIKDNEKSLSDNKVHLINCQKAQLIIQLVANQTQSQLEYRLNELVTLAMQAVFQEDAYELKMRFDIKRGRTEAAPLFVKNDKERRPKYGSGFGLADVSSFALRPTLWSLEQNKKRPLFVFDEPMRHLNSIDGSLHKRASKMMREISKKLNVQIIIVTQNNDLCEAGDIVYRINQRDDISYAEVIQ